MTGPHREEPPWEAYSRVTNPERYHVLHERARALVDELVAEFAVDRIEGATEHRAPGQRDLTGEVIELRPPVDGGAGALVLVLDSFPGVHVRIGRWSTATFPHCGCDACDEQPGDVASELDAYVRGYVDGGFAEELRRRELRTTMVTPGWTSSGSVEIDMSVARALGTQGRTNRAPWPARP